MLTDTLSQNDLCIPHFNNAVHIIYMQQLVILFHFNDYIFYQTYKYTKYAKLKYIDQEIPFTLIVYFSTIC